MLPPNRLTFGCGSVALGSWMDFACMPKQMIGVGQGRVIVLSLGNVNGDFCHRWGMKA